MWIFKNMFCFKQLIGISKTEYVSHQQDMTFVCVSSTKIIIFWQWYIEDYWDRLIFIYKWHNLQTNKMHLNMYTIDLNFTRYYYLPAASRCDWNLSHGNVWNITNDNQGNCSFHQWKNYQNWISHSENYYLHPNLRTHMCTNLDLLL